MSAENPGMRTAARRSQKNHMGWLECERKSSEFGSVFLPLDGREEGADEENGHAEIE